MAGCVHEIENIGFAVFGFVIQPNRLCFDGDPAFALDIHRIKNLFHHFTLSQAPCVLDQAVGERGFSMVDMGNDGKIADLVKTVCGHGLAHSSRGLFFQVLSSKDGFKICFCGVSNRKSQENT